MKIITISRQFGSGGRELGKRLADILGWDYYDKEIIEAFEHGMRTRLLACQREIIQKIAEAGNDCIIVGRDADVILQEYRPFRIFVCADLQARLDRCMAYERKRPRSVRLTEKEILRNIRQIDKSRSRTREILTGKRHGDSSMFDLTLNASGWEIKRLAFATADFAARWLRILPHAGSRCRMKQRKQAWTRQMPRRMGWTQHESTG